MTTQCPNCGFYKLEPRRSRVIAAGLLIMGCGYVAGIVEPIVTKAIFAGLAICIGGLFIGGTVCRHCGQVIA